MGRGRSRFERRQRRRAREPQQPEDTRATITLAAHGETPIILKVKDFKVDLNRDYVDATVFGNANKTYLAGIRNWIITASE